MKRLLLFTLYALAIAAYLALGWIPGAVLVALAIFGTLRSFARTARELAPTAICPRGHTFPTYGRVECSACHWVAESSLWRCVNCGAAFNTRCPTCGLSVRNPSL